MEHLERQGFLRRGIERHARLSAQLRNESVLGFVHNRSLALRLKRKHNTSISLMV